MKGRLDKKQAKEHTPSKAAYDIPKLEGKGLVENRERQKIQNNKKRNGYYHCCFSLNSKNNTNHIVLNK